MAEVLVKKKRIRAGHRASATRMLHQVEGLLADSTIETPADTAVLSRIKLSLQEKLDTLKTLDGEILDLTEEENLEDEIGHADLFKENIYTVMINIDKNQSATERSLDLTVEPTPATRVKRVNLPKLTLRSFNGEITMWTTFWDSFESAIHNNTDLSDIDKFNYLKTFLERTASEAISGLTLTSANYREDISILKKRFGNKQQIISKHMDMLLNIEPITSPHNLKGLRHLYDLVESHVRSLKSLGVTSETYGSLLSSVLLNKLPQDLRLIVSRKITDEDWNLDGLMVLMVQEVEARERAAATQTDPIQRGRKPDKGPHTAAALMSGNSNPTCCFCDQQHPSDACRVVPRIDERKAILMRAGRCFTCLRRGHISRDCRSKGKCTKCSGRHHVSICMRGSGSSSHMSSNPAGTVTPGQPTKDPLTSTNKHGLNPEAAAYKSTSTSLYVDASNTVLLQTAQTVVYNLTAPQSPLQVRAILDSGSQKSYVTSRVKDALSLKPEGEQRVSIQTFGSENEEPRTCEIVRIGMKMQDGDKEMTLFTVPLICEPLAGQPISICAEEYGHLSPLSLADTSDGETSLEVDMLLGADYYWDLVTGETRRGKTGPIAISTRLGWVLSGPAHSLKQCSTTVSLITTHTLQQLPDEETLKKLDCELRAFWELESLGIKDPDTSVYEEFGNSIQFKKGRYEVSLPWKDLHATLPNNYHLSLKRLRGLLRRLRQNPMILQEYNSIIQDQIRQGIVQIVENPEYLSGEKVHYLPHHAVIRQDKATTKLRVVYDASAKSEGASLNDCLYTGPKFDQNILDILLRFRTHRVALTADIEKAFLMISMAEKDRDVLRFLWIDDIVRDQPEIVVLRFARVVFGVSASPFLLNATIRHHIEKFSRSHPELVRKLLQSTYVDDIVTGADSETLAYQLYKGAKDVLKQGGFNLRKFVTNAHSLQGRIDRSEERLLVGNSESESSEPVPEETYTKSTIGSTQEMSSGEQKILGVRWNVSADRLVFNLEDIVCQAKDLEPTKRNVISIVGKC